MEYITPEKDVKTSLAAKGIRLDIYAVDENGTAYDIEMQTTDEHDTVMRARYYESALDEEAMGSGTSYKDLRKTIIIFICTFDIFGKNLREPLIICTIRVTVRPRLWLQRMNIRLRPSRGLTV